jgi:diaminohydroxyphosphoribosylaminopyrimidine deaminase/5-amino-6-(5-phosphoribosylamino)uracil reductase
VARDNNIVGEGFHPEAGQPHAEIFALRAAGDLAQGADLYVTLEPCCHQGRTGPCTEAIIEAGVSRVFVGAQDPNPLVAGKGVERLRGAAIEVVTDILNHECRRLIAPFAKHVSSGLPYVVLKSAMTLDGQTATLSGDSKWISCETSRTLVHQLRDQVDAIMVGSGTILADNPKLTTRLAEGGRDPVRIVMDGGLRTSPDDVDLRPYREAGADIILVSRAAGSLDLIATLKALASRNLHYVLLEGGSLLGGAMLRAGLIDRLMLFVAPKLLGGQGRGLLTGSGVDVMADAFALKHLSARKVDTDILLEGEVLNVYRPD